MKIKDKRPFMRSVAAERLVKEDGSRYGRVERLRFPIIGIATR